MTAYSFTDGKWKMYIEVYQDTDDEGNPISDPVHEWVHCDVFDVPVPVLINECDSLILELSHNEVEHYKLKQEYETASEKLLEAAAKEKANDNDIIKAKYGGNNDKTRKKYVREELAEEYSELKQIEFRNGYLKRYIPFLKTVINAKVSLMELDDGER